ncbi:hypothetical protein HBHAL_4059 [Halobacillus halophilus DSM 2266]|uniref:Uncharacterized protein n=1 Tax=Halobacillus halophilus (strain ATCC 35676 / DSM 2266 / JCM 20832 / KCTC 3685 / LMG 17431 / NBRC 102448 / NCIMB 2269) TaxID=866895 RepID=I0JQI0_HALH3|nr:hypothetical protein HBHAL_4059 [Halobacillus halophilus DSM 2266]
MLYPSFFVDIHKQMVEAYQHCSIFAGPTHQILTVFLLSRRLFTMSDEIKSKWVERELLLI